MRARYSLLLASFLLILTGSGHAAPPVVESISTAGSVGATPTLTINYPSGVTAGDLILAIIANDDNGSTPVFDDVTKPTGYSLEQEGGNTSADAHFAVYWKEYQGTEGASETFTSSSERYMSGAMLRVSGADTSTPFDVKSTPVDTSGTSHAIGGVTTTVADALAFYVLAFDGADGAPFSVSGTGWAENAEAASDGSSTGSSMAVGSKDMATAGATGTATVTSTVSDGAMVMQFAIAPGGGGAAQSPLPVILQQH